MHACFQGQPWALFANLLFQVARENRRASIAFWLPEASQ
jgi:hypothetical protein